MWGPSSKEKEKLGQFKNELNGSYSVYSCSQAQAGGQEDSSFLPVWIPAQDHRMGRTCLLQGPWALEWESPPHMPLLCWPY